MQMSLDINIPRSLLSHTLSVERAKELFDNLKTEVLIVARTGVETGAKQVVRVDTGRLRSSIHTRQTARTATKFVVATGTKVHYGPIIEARYPYLSRALIASQPELDRRVRKTIEQYVRRS